MVNFDPRPQQTKYLTSVKVLPLLIDDSFSDSRPQNHCRDPHFPLCRASNTHHCTVHHGNGELQPKWPNPKPKSNKLTNYLCSIKVLPLLIGDSLLRLEATEPLPGPPLPTVPGIWYPPPHCAPWPGWLCWTAMGVQISCPDMPVLLLYALIEDVITGKSIWFVIDEVSEPRRSLLGLGRVIWGRLLRVPYRKGPLTSCNKFDCITLQMFPPIKKFNAKIEV